jgi:hypothetical protein
MSNDPILTELMDELQAYPASYETKSSAQTAENKMAGVVVPFQLRTEDGILGFISTTTILGTPADVILSGLAIGALFPADTQTAEALRSVFKSEPQKESNTRHQA